MTEFNSTATTAKKAAGNTLNKAGEKWFLKRGIDPETVIGCGISTRGEGQDTVVVFPFVEQGQTVNNKYRAFNRDTGQFKRFWQDENPKRTFWNPDAIQAAVDNDKPLVITEGEMDALTVIEAGYPYVVSVPDGAPKQASDEPINRADDLKYDFLWNNMERLDKVSEIVLAGDADGPGEALNHELSRRLGIERCRYVEYPEGCKDLNDVLLKLDGKAVRSCIDNAKLYPVKGLYELNDYPAPRKPILWSTHIPGMDDHMMIELARLLVLTGIPGHGKSTLADIVAFNMAFYHGWHVCVGTFESQPNKGWLRQIVKRFRSQQINNRRPTELEAIAWVQNHFSFIGQNPTMDEDADLTLENVIEFAEISVCRYGTKMLLLDPWNELEHKRRRDETETEYTNRAIKTIKAFNRRFDVFTIVVAHPTKMADRGTVKKPTLYDVNGSANWFNKADYGAVVWRDDVAKSQTTEIKISKVKDQDDGLGRPGKIDMEYDRNCGFFFPSIPGPFGNLPPNEPDLVNQSEEVA